MTQESGFEQTVRYDVMLWEDVQDRLSKGDRHINPSKQMSNIVEKIESKAEKKVSQTEPRSSGVAKFCSICNTTTHNTEDCRRKDKAKGKWCPICRKDNHSKEDCYYNEKKKDIKSKGGKSKGSKGKSKGQK